MAFSTTTTNTANNNNSTANQTSWTFSTGFGLTKNRVLVLIIGKDNNGTADGDNSDVTSVYQGQTNITFTKAVEFTNANGSAQAGACVSIWYRRVNQFVGGTNITANYAGSSNNDKSAMALLEFSIDPGSVLGVASTATLANDAADPGSLGLSGLPSREYLFIRGIAAESNSTTALTNTASWTVGPADTTSGGASAANMAIRCEYRVLTGTGATSDPTLYAADCASALVAFYEVPAVGPPFPGRQPHPAMRRLVRR
jgi:hypothetical protein